MGLPKCRDGTRCRDGTKCRDGTRRRDGKMPKCRNERTRAVERTPLPKEKRKKGLFFSDRRMGRTSSLFRSRLNVRGSMLGEGRVSPESQFHHVPRPPCQSRRECAPSTSLPLLFHFPSTSRQTKILHSTDAVEGADKKPNHQPPSPDKTNKTLGKGNSSASCFHHLGILAIYNNPPQHPPSTSSPATTLPSQARG